MCSKFQPWKTWSFLFLVKENLMLLLEVLFIITGSGVVRSLISDTDTRGDLGIRHALFFACWKDIGGGERDGGGVGRDGGGTEVSTLAGNGTTPDIV